MFLQRELLCLSLACRLKISVNKTKIWQQCQMSYVARDCFGALSQHFGSWVCNSLQKAERQIAIYASSCNLLAPDQGGLQNSPIIWYVVSMCTESLHFRCEEDL